MNHQNIWREKKTGLSFYLFTACNQFVNELCLPALCFLDVLFKLPDLYAFEKKRRRKIRRSKMGKLTEKIKENHGNAKKKSNVPLHLAYLLYFSLLPQAVFVRRFEL